MTAGFVPMSQNIMYYHSLAIEFTLMLVMAMGCINFMLHAEICYRAMCRLAVLDNRNE